ncbi:MAG: transglutaminase domain-containing protein [Bacteroidota bacterium]
MANLDDLYHLEWSFIKDVNKTISPELKNITDSIVKGVSANEEKTKRIYKWVQKNIKYVAFEEGMEGFVPREANLVCSRRFGDCKDMASILTVMLQYAGVPAYFTWIGSRALPYDYTDVHLPITDNHMIATVKLDTGYVFLDGTDSHCVFGSPSGHIQGKQALIGISEHEYKIIRVPEYAKEKSQLVDTTYLQLTDKGITGSISINMTGYYATDMYGMMSYTNEKDREKYMKGYFNRGSNKFRLNKYDITDTDNPNTFRLTGQFELQDYGKKIADEWYLNLNLFKFYEHREIDYPKRNIPIEHDYKSTSKYVTILNIPEGYKISYLPESKSFRNDVWGFDITYEQKTNQVVMTQSFDNNSLLLQPDKFQAWNKVLENLFPLYKETISLSKK